MSTRRHHTIANASRKAAFSLLCMLTVLSVGCSSPRIYTSPARVQRAAYTTTKANQHAPTIELPPPRVVAANTPATQSPTALADPGAKALVNSMLASIPDRITDSDGATRIGVVQILNQSRSRGSEFNEFRQRLARTLTQAADDPHIIFVADDESKNQYEIQGAAYLITRDGFDMWELFLSLTASDVAYSLWQGDPPVHMFRQTRPGQLQILP